MKELTVVRGMMLRTFLQSNHVQAWRIAVLIRIGALTVQRDNAPLPLARKGADTHVEPDDRVRIEDPLTRAHQDALQAFVDAEARDYAWVPGTSKYDVVMAKLLARRPRTILVVDPSIRTLPQFIAMFGASPLVKYPIRDVLVASHANDEGELKLPLGGTAKFIDYEDLEAAAKDPRMQFDDDWFKPRPRDPAGRPLPYRLLLHGCRVGTQPRFLARFREVLGRRIQIVAPRHFDAGYPQPNRPQGYIEYLDYSFSAHSPTPLGTPKAIVTALMGVPQNTYRGGVPIPLKTWTRWVPARPESTYEQPATDWGKSPIERKPVRLVRRFRYQARAWLPKPERLAVEKTETTDAQRLAVLRRLLATRDNLKPSHPYPLYERLGYGSFDEFIAGWTWVFTPKGRKVDEVHFNAVRHEYTVIVPVLDTRGVLMLNFSPIGSRDKPVEGLDTADDTLFGTA